jgi:DNA-binding CsgD family transcriptional regulator
MSQAGGDPVAILEAAYSVDRDEAAWLASVLEVVGPGLDRGHGASAFLYDASDVSRMRVWSYLGGPTGRGPAIAQAITASTPERLHWTFRTQSCAVASEGPGWDDQPASQLFRQWGVEDILFVNGLDPTGIGCFLTARMPARAPPTPAVRQKWSRVAVHLAAAYRLQRRLSELREEPDAVLDPGGRVLHAEPGASGNAAREALRHLARAIDRARGGLRRRDPDEALFLWKRLAEARWSLVDQFESDGRRFLVARRNDVRLPRPRVLTDRERQVAAQAALGLTNKHIAYALGLSTGTVSTHLSAAMRKLDLRSRADLTRCLGGLVEGDE